MIKSLNKPTNDAKETSKMPAIKIIIIMLVMSNILISQVVEAKQSIKLKGDDEVSIWASSIELNRVKAVDDRIKYVRANEGELELISDKESGEIYIKPKSLEVTHIFITTEKGYTYKIGVKTDTIAAQQIFLKNEDAEVKEVAKAITEVSPDKIIALELIKAARKGVIKNGYIESKATNVIKKPDFKLIGVKKYRGEKFICEKFLIKAHRWMKGSVQEETFFNEGVIAVSLDKYLKAKENGYVYIVRRAI
ncbi:MAG: type-F conjugative transfer system secretin TraK [Proteobacteria bacterium]|nr:type-F conjugative transfer system secretin TraK [Pseudomonadota bacterium]